MRIVLVLTATLAALVLSACGGGDSTSPAGTTSTPPAPESGPSGPEGVVGDGEDIGDSAFAVGKCVLFVGSDATIAGTDCPTSPDEVGDDPYDPLDSTIYVVTSTSEDPDAECPPVEEEGSLHNKFVDSYGVTHCVEVAQVGEAAGLSEDVTTEYAEGDCVKLEGSDTLVGIPCPTVEDDFDLSLLEVDSVIEGADGSCDPSVYSTPSDLTEVSDVAANKTYCLSAAQFGSP